uniref:Uncharacterized protein n=1 Tax=Cacopsylla melanoneura TaxID=428564 RepID=A0A8D8R5J7_9HEMI
MNQQTLQFYLLYRLSNQTLIKPLDIEITLKCLNFQIPLKFPSDAPFNIPTPLEPQFVLQFNSCTVKILLTLQRQLVYPMLNLILTIHPQSFTLIQIMCPTQQAILCILQTIPWLSLLQFLIPI